MNISNIHIMSDKVISTSKTKKKSSYTWVWVLLAIVLAIIVGVIIYFTVKKKDDTKPPPPPPPDITKLYTKIIESGDTTQDVVNIDLSKNTIYFIDVRNTKPVTYTIKLTGSDGTEIIMVNTNGWTHTLSVPNGIITPQGTNTVSITPFSWISAKISNKKLMFEQETNPGTAFALI